MKEEFYIAYRMRTEPPETIRRLQFEDLIEFRKSIIKMLYDMDYVFCFAGRCDNRVLIVTRTPLI